MNMFTNVINMPLARGESSGGSPALFSHGLPGHYQEFLLWGWQEKMTQLTPTLVFSHIYTDNIRRLSIVQCMCNLRHKQTYKQSNRQGWKHKVLGRSNEIPNVSVSACGHLWITYRGERSDVIKSKYKTDWGTVNLWSFLSQKTCIPLEFYVQSIIFWNIKLFPDHSAFLCRRKWKWVCDFSVWFYSIATEI